jgi:DNA-binding Xre family transcriptional regulator
MSSVQLIAFIEQRLTVLRLSKTALAKQAKISRAALYKILGGEVQEAKLSTLIRLAVALDCHPLDLLRQLFSRWELPVKTSIGARYAYDASGFVADMTYPDNSMVTVGQVFEKVWEIKNLGKQVWQGRKLVCVDEFLQVSRHGEEEDELAMRLPIQERGLITLVREVAIPTTQPNDNVRLAVSFRAPEYPGSMISFWKMQDAEGELCFPELEGVACLVKVVGI